MDERELGALVVAGREERNLEYKRAAPWTQLRGQIVRTALGMANIEGGGFVVVGVNQQDQRFEPVGIDPADLATYRSDEIKARINSFADPFVESRVERVTLDGKAFVVIQVDEFSEVPVVARDHGEGIRKGALYVRSLRTIETAEVQNQTDMRAVIDLAVAKGVAKTLRTLARAGISIPELAARTDEARFAEEIEGL